MTSIRQFIQRHQTNLLRASFVVLVLYWVYAIYLRWHNLMGAFVYSNFELDDWMINYEGGFVRRGLMGQLLYEIYQWHPYPVRNVVIVVVICSLLSFMALVVRLYIKEKWSVVSLVAIPFFGLAFSMFSVYRRDFVMLVAVYCVFYALKKYWEEGKWIWWLCIQCLAVLSILSHEATFFFMLPIMMMVHWFKLQRQGVDRYHAIRKMSVLFVLPLLAMGVCVVFKGNAEIVAAIWKSWEPCMNRYPLPGDITLSNNGINALLWDTWDTFKMHMSVNFASVFWPEFPIVRKLPFVLFGYVCVYYLVLKINTVDLQWNKLAAFDETLLSNVLLLQFVFLLPMFTVLSCDINRVMTYWIFSSLFVFHFFKDKSLYPSRITRISIYIQNKMSGWCCISNPWFYLLIIVLLPMDHAGSLNIYSSIVMRAWKTLAVSLGF